MLFWKIRSSCCSTRRSPTSSICRRFRAGQVQPPAADRCRRCRGRSLADLVVEQICAASSVATCAVARFGDRRKAMLEDIAILTGGQVIAKSAGRRSKSHPGDLGPGQAHRNRQRKHHPDRRRRQIPKPSKARQGRSVFRSKKHRLTTTAKAAGASPRSWPAAWPSSRLAQRPKPK